MNLKAPFPYFGGKSRLAAAIWERLGEVDVYAEPFAGSLAVLLANPHPAKLEVVCDTDALLCNFWRAMRNDPEALAAQANYPSIQQDLTARHKWLIAWRKDHADKLSEDPDYYDVKAAAWWVWGMSISIGNNWQRDARDRMPKIISRGQGVSRIKQPLDDWFANLAQRLSRVIVLNKGWESSVTPVALEDTPDSSPKTRRAVFMDPPYLRDNRETGIYGDDDSDQAARDAWDWAVRHGSRYRIAYACVDGDFDLPPDWTKITRRFDGYRNSGQNKTEKYDCVMFSPACREAPQKELEV